MIDEDSGQGDLSPIEQHRETMTPQSNMLNGFTLDTKPKHRRQTFNE